MTTRGPDEMLAVDGEVERVTMRGPGEMLALVEQTGGSELGQGLPMMTHTPHTTALQEDDEQQLYKMMMTVCWCPVFSLMLLQYMYGGGYNL